MRISFVAAATAVAGAAAVAVVSLAGVTTAAAPAPQAPDSAPAKTGSADREPVVVTDLPEGPREYLAEELCDKEPLPSDKAHLERLDGLGGA